MDLVVHASMETLNEMTGEQAKRALILAVNHRVVRVAGAMFDLPEGYVTFAQHSHNGNVVYGGIDPEGSAST